MKAERWINERGRNPPRCALARFHEEEGGLRDVLGQLRQAYFDRAADLMPNDTAALLKLGMAAKIVDQIEAHVGHIIRAGKLDQAAQDHADRIARLPEARRRFL